MNPLCWVAVIWVVAWLVGVVPAQARSHFGGKKGETGEPQEPGRPDAGSKSTALEDRLPSGLVPVFPSDAACPDIASPFGSRERYDGSRRPLDREGGFHGGIDISLQEGTPLRAIAAGRVIAKGEGYTALGIYLWLQHSPQDTGLPFWVYSKYQHFRALPELNVGDAVSAGQVVGPSGSTGTHGRHYGAGGYPHLHLTTWASPSDQYEVSGTRVGAPGARIFDPLALYVTGLRGLDEIKGFSGDRRKVVIPYVTDDGARHPAGAPLVWPVACRRR